MTLTTLPLVLHACTAYDSVLLVRI